MSDTGLRITAWLLTYALHSTVLLCAAALLTARVVRGEAWRETLWKAALLGGIVTASIQSAGWMTGDLGGREFVLRSAPAPTSTPMPIPDAAPPSISSAETAPSSSAIASTSAVHPGDASRTADAATPRPAPSSPPPLLEWAMLAWAAGAAAMLARLGWRQVRLYRLLRHREAVSDGAVLAMLAELRRNAGLWRPVWLTACPATPTPLALGGGEICVPPRFLTGLDPEQQRNALAHELAHLARRDPAWHFAIGILESVFFFQPLNRMARARLRDSAEFLCDAWAARQTGSPLGLARCLAEVASWVAPGRPPIPAGTMAMAEGGSPLVQRVQRLTSWRGEPREGNGLLRVAAAALLIAAVAAIAPAVASTNGAGREPASAGRAAGQADGQEPVIIRHPDASQPLARRWAWGVEQIGRLDRGRAWIAYSVPTRLAPDQGAERGGIERSSRDRAPLNALLNAPEDHAVLLFAVSRDGALERVSGRRGVGMDLGGRPVMWLGAAQGAESFAQLRGMADGLRDPGLRAHLVQMIGIHPGSQAVPYLAGVLGRDGNDGVRRQAAGALALHATDESLAALRTAVRRDRSDEVRREAVEAAGVHGTAPAAALLRELATGHRDPDIRSTAAEALGRHPDLVRLETLRAVVFGDRDADVAREAVKALQRFDPARSGPLLERIAWTHPVPDVARQAAESLGRLPAPWGVTRLDSIARRHPDADIAAQAVESLGAYPESVTGGYLRAIARTHPAPRVREEARDQLAMGDAHLGTGRPPADVANAGDMDAIMDAIMDADPSAETEPDSEAQARAEAKREARFERESGMDSEAQARAEAKREAGLERESEVDSEAEARAEAEAEAEFERESEMDSEAEARAEAKAEAGFERESEVDSEAEARAEAAAEAKRDFGIRADPAGLETIRAVRATSPANPRPRRADPGLSPSHSTKNPSPGATFGHRQDRDAP